MKNCPYCDTHNEDSNKYCQQCGKQIESVVIPPEQAARQHGTATIFLTRPISPGSTAPRRAVPLDRVFSAGNKLVIGRAPDCDVRLEHPSVSRYHAVLERLPQGMQLSDLRSINGVFVDGRRISDPVYLKQKQRVGIGPFLFSLEGETLHSVDSSRSLRLEARGLEKAVLLPTRQKRKLLDNINLVVNPGEFVSLLGPSGSGKSTLMDCLNGRRRATGGKVLANGEDFYQHFDNFRQSLGYVPQKDIVHSQLSVYRALYYTAKLRLPTDTDRTELTARVEAVLEEMELGPHRQTLIANLSGGQIKRVSLGAELLARPCMLYIDEATSGLDAGTESRMMRLFRQLANEGRSILCITHNVDNVDQCHLVLVLARGKLMYYGPPTEAPRYFGVERISDIYDRLQEKEAEDWERQFALSSLYQEFVAGRLAQRQKTAEELELPRLHPSPVPDAEDQESAPAVEEREQRAKDNKPGSKESKWPLLARRFHELTTAAGRELIRPVSELWHQFKVLTRRYAELVWSEPRSVRLLFLQAPIVALFILIGFVNKPYQGEIPATRKLTDQERQAVLAVREILKDLREGKSMTPEQRQALAQVKVPALKGEGEENLEEVLKRVDGPEQERVLDYLLENSEPIIPSGIIINPAYTYMLLNILVIAVLWFGCNNSAKEIVKEEAIYGRERAVNLRILPYLGSKFLILSIVSAVQTLLLMLVIYGTLEMLHTTLGHDVTPRDYRLDYVTQYGVLVLLSMAGVALGLLISSCVSSPDRANALLPYVLIPQMILGGGVIAVREGAIYWLAVTVSPVYWAYRAVRAGETQLPQDFYYTMSYNDNVLLCCGALVAQMAVLLLLTGWFLRRKDMRWE